MVVAMYMGETTGTKSPNWMHRRVLIEIFLQRPLKHANHFNHHRAGVVTIYYSDQLMRTTLILVIRISIQTNCSKCSFPVLIEICVNGSFQFQSLAQVYLL